MSNASAVPAPGVLRNALRRRAVVGVLVVACAILTLAYVRIGWDQMVTACTADGPTQHPSSSVEFGWSWSPLGFRCTYDDGTADTSLWF